MNNLSNFIPVLTGDIGGTNSRLEVIHLSKDLNQSIKMIVEKRFDSQKYQSLTSILKEFLKDLEGTINYPEIGVLGICGPVFDNEVTILANLENWKDVNGEVLAKNLNLKQMVLLNDFVCCGYGILSNIKEGVDFSRLNNIPVSDNAPIAMIGAGTGLGHGFLVKNKNSKYYEVYSAEGGHQDFAPQNETEWELFKYLQNHYKVSHISVERACSGPVIGVMFQFFVEKYKISSHLVKDEREFSKIKNEDIIKAGLNNSCPACVKTLELFVSIYGAISGNYALATLPLGGVYLLGGLSVTLENYLIKEKIFKENFVKKGRLQTMMEKFPLFVVSDPHLGVRGSREYARRLLEG